MKKRLLTIIITLAMAMGMISAATTTVFAADVYKSGTWGEYEKVDGDYIYTYADFSPFANIDGGYTADDAYEIRTPAQLAGFAALVNASFSSPLELTGINNSKASVKNFAGRYVKLTANIDLSEHLWIPIGADSSNEFKGNFDGNGYTISGMAIGTANAANPECQYAGLFGYMTAGSIKNLSVSGLVNVSYSTKAYAGGIVGYANAITIENCSSTVSVTASSTGTAYAGGLVGQAANVTIANCYSAGSVSGTTAGGLVGYVGNLVTIEYCYWYMNSSLNSNGAGDYTNDSSVKLAQEQMKGSAGATDSSWENISIIEKYGSLVDALNEWVNNNPSYTPWHIHEGGYPTLGVGETITPNTDGQTHTVTCGCNISTTEKHSGGTATCTEQAKCQHCDASYGEVGGHTPDAAGYTDNGNGTHSSTCAVCGNVTEEHAFDENGTCVCGINLFTVSGSTLTIDGTLGGKTEATEEDITVLVNKIEDCVDSGITTIIVTGSEPALIEMDSWTNTAIGEAIYRLSGSDDYD
ncbi:MAG: hypothetical protein IJB43_06335, partial [Clostridia bacterium]|nr:hypothetical protein [Clostridia bacterium]